jgi:hypothetical protein
MSEMCQVLLQSVPSCRTRWEDLRGDREGRESLKGSSSTGPRSNELRDYPSLSQMFDSVRKDGRLQQDHVWFLQRVELLFVQKASPGLLTFLPVSRSTALHVWEKMQALHNE